MDFLSIDSVVAGPHGQPQPTCWDWNKQMIINYVTQNKSRVMNFFNNLSQGNAITMSYCNRMVEDVLIHCLRERETYAAKPNAQGILLQSGEIAFDRISIPVPYGNATVPISDVYGALGWFISHAEAPTNRVEKHRRRLLCYTRLCHNIGRDFATERNVGGMIYPSKTHQLIVNRFEILCTDTEGSKGTLDLMSSLASSLPRDIGNRKIANDNTLKKDQILVRDNNLRHLSPEVSTVVGHIERGDPRIAQFPVGACAESVNYTCQFTPGKTVHALGQALDVKSVMREFTTFEELLSRAAVDPCPNCLHLFTHGTVRHYDVGSGLYTSGPSNESQIPQHWLARHQETVLPCQRCENRPINKDLPCGNCGLRLWCSESCFAKDDFHSGTCGRAHPSGSAPPPGPSLPLLHGVPEFTSPPFQPFLVRGQGPSYDSAYFEQLKEKYPNGYGFMGN